MKHCPEYEMHSAPCTNDSSDTPGTAERMARMSCIVFSRASTTRCTPSCSSTVGACSIVHRHLRRAVDLQRGVHAPDQADEPQVLHDHRIDAAIDALAEQCERVCQLGGLDEGVQREIDARPARVREPTCLIQLVERELRAIVARIESLGAQINRVGAIGDRGPRGVERAGG